MDEKLTRELESVEDRPTKVDFPVVIQNDADYERIAIIFNKLSDKGEENLSETEKRLFRLLTDVKKDFERRNGLPS